MQVLLNLQNEGDLLKLMPILEQLNIQFAEIPLVSKKKNQPVEKPTAEKNYDLEQLELLFDALQKAGSFSEIADPVAWQKQLRDEWN